jgi:hypothetical protein
VHGVASVRCRAQQRQGLGEQARRHFESQLAVSAFFRKRGISLEKSFRNDTRPVMTSSLRFRAIWKADSRIDPSVLEDCLREDLNESAPPYALGLSPRRRARAFRSGRSRHNGSAKQRGEGAQGYQLRCGSKTNSGVSAGVSVLRIMFPRGSSSSNARRLIIIMLPLPERLRRSPTSVKPRSTPPQASPTCESR